MWMGVFFWTQCTCKSTVYLLTYLLEGFSRQATTASSAVTATNHSLLSDNNLRHLTFAIVFVSATTGKRQTSAIYVTHRPVTSLIYVAGIGDLMTRRTFVGLYLYLVDKQLVYDVDSTSCPPVSLAVNVGLDSDVHTVSGCINVINNLKATHT